MSKTLSERFAEKVNLDGPVPAHAPQLGPCHIWTAARRSDGYGHMMLVAAESPRGKNGPVLAQRVAWFEHYNRWPHPFAIQVCRIKLCVRWEHLVEGPRGSGRVPLAEKPCRKCGSLDRNHKGDCRLCHVERENARYHADPIARRERDRERYYGITPEQQRALYDSQDGRCANKGCRVQIDYRKAHVDHDHACCAFIPACGTCVRGFLCGDCNTALGRSHDNEARILGLVDYLRAWRASRAG
jgi:hypothetical protein